MDQKEIESVLKGYKRNGYPINRALINSKAFSDISPEIQKTILTIEKALKPGNEIRLYRGMSNIDNLIKISNVLVHKNFCSASKDIEIAQMFADECCILSFLLPEYIKRYDYNDAKEQEVLIQRNVQFTIDPDYRVIDGVKVFDSTISLYEEPKINNKLQEKSSHQLDAMMIAEAWKKELPDSFTIADVDALLETKKSLNLVPETYQMVETILKHKEMY